VLRNKYAHGIFAINSRKNLCIVRKGHYGPINDVALEILYVNSLVNELMNFISSVDELKGLYLEIWEDVPPEIREAWQKIWLLRTPPRPPSQV
jgi:hypothetical protein